MKKGATTNVNSNETLIETNKEEALQQRQLEEEEEEREAADNFPPEEFLDEFQCCVCLELLYKPVVLGCGHLSCFWCVYNAMNHIHESNCPICRCPYTHFPSVCQLLHFLLLKLYPVAYKRRERQVREEEKTAGHFSPQIDQNLCEPKLCESSDILGNKKTLARLQMDLHSESCSKDSESTSFRDPPKATMQDENGMPVKPTSFSKSPEVAANASNGFERRDQKVVSVADLLCAACKKLLFRPVVLNCGHVYCESCFVIPKDEMLRCQVCRSLQPNGFPGVCLILDHFLEKQFPEEYLERKGAFLKEHNSSIQAQRHANRATSISTDVYSSWIFGNGPKVHIAVGCDYCGMSPIIGERYKCTDCVEKIGFDLCESCYNSPAKVPGRFNQQHKPDHKFEVMQPLSIRDFVSRLNSEQSDDDGSDASGQMDGTSHTPPMLSASVRPDEGDDGSQEPEDTSSLIFSVDVSLDQEDDESDDQSDNISSDLIPEMPAFMNGRLGDFGLARMHGHGQVASTTRVVGTVGYMAPEVIRSGRASTQTDVFGFGILILEVMCGRRPIEEGKPPLVDWVWQLMMQHEILAAVDARLRTNGGFDEEEVEKLLHLGLLCSHPNPDSRPTMRQVVKVLEGQNEPCESEETEDMESYLLQKVKSRDTWVNYSQNFGYASHPTFDVIRQSHSSSISLSWTNSTVEGR